MGTDYITQADIARALGVSPNTVSVWRRRYPDFPSEDVMLGSVPGWLPTRLGEITAWRDSRPGQGKGGGRPRKDA